MSFNLFSFDSIKNFLKKEENTQSDFFFNIFPQAQESFFSSSMYAFYETLQKVKDPNSRIFVKVSIKSLLKYYYKEVDVDEEIAQKAFDFILYNKDDFSLEKAFILKKRREKIDKRIRKLCTQIGLPLIIVPEKEEYSEKEVAKMFKKKMTLFSILGF